MREKLLPLEGRRCTFQATFERFGNKRAYRGPPLVTMLFKDIKGTGGEVLADHVWFIRRKRLDGLLLQPGESIEFDATVKRYTKGYRGRRDDDEDHAPIGEDFCLANPNKFRRLAPRPDAGTQDVLQLISES